MDVVPLEGLLGIKKPLKSGAFSWLFGGDGVHLIKRIKICLITELNYTIR